MLLMFISNQRLKEFEARERKKMREYEKQTVKDEKAKDNEVRKTIYLAKLCLVFGNRVVGPFSVILQP